MYDSKDGSNLHLLRLGGFEIEEWAFNWLRRKAQTVSVLGSHMT